MKKGIPSIAACFLCAALLFSGCGAQPDLPTGIAGAAEQSDIPSTGTAATETSGDATTTAAEPPASTTAATTSTRRTDATTTPTTNTTTSEPMPATTVPAVPPEWGKIVDNRFVAPDGSYAISLIEADDWKVIEAGNDCVRLQSMRFIDTAVLKISRSPATASAPIDDRTILHYVSAVMTGGGYGSPIKRQELSGMQTVAFGYSGIYTSLPYGQPAKDPYVGQVAEDKSYAYTNTELWGCDGVYDYKLIFHVRSYKFEDSDTFRSYMRQYVDLLTQSLLTFELLDPA